MSACRQWACHTMGVSGRARVRLHNECLLIILCKSCDGPTLESGASDSFVCCLLLLLAVEFFKRHFVNRFTLPNSTHSCTHSSTPHPAAKRNKKLNMKILDRHSQVCLDSLYFVGVFSRCLGYFGIAFLLLLLPLTGTGSIIEKECTGTAWRGHSKL